ncbi:MAG: iron ABC transporter permease [Candidatus Tectomicrobia bacterium]|uniref:Iron ABC transporter permease n=1 Tax=Tectimicrobiota bacterium TaxID=2528274 RepID=A0A932GR26_UNCTE|nr:iron ABC transporter permease [Candidatus Tectomicrobia bacterium]
MELAGTLGMSRFRGVRIRHPGATLLLLFLLAFTLVPLLTLILGSFSNSTAIGEFKNPGLQNYARAYLRKSTMVILGNTLILTAGSVLLGVSLALVMAWLVERTNLPCRGIAFAAIPLTLAIPGVLHAIAWVMLFSPRMGYINRWLMSLFGLGTAPFNTYTLPGMIILESLRVVPTSFLLMVPLFRNMDPALEEAAAVSGAGPFSRLRRITLRVLSSGIVAVLIYETITVLETFEIPGILGLPARIYVFSTKIYAVTQGLETPDYGQANALSVAYVLLAAVGVVLYSKAIRRAEKFAVVSGRDYKPKRLDLGRWKYVAFGAVVLYLLLTLVLPLLVLLWTSLIPFPTLPTAKSLSLVSLDNYRTIAIYGATWKVLKNTVLMVAVTAVGTILLSFMISWVLVRTRFWGRRLMDMLAFLPRSIPGIVMALALIWIFLMLKPYVPIYGTIWLISLGFMMSFMAYGTRAMTASLLQIHRELEEAAYLSGATLLETFRRIHFPLLIPAFVGLGIWSMFLSVRLTGLPLMLYEGAENQVLSVFIWMMWDDGQMGAVSGIGVLTILFLFMVAMGMRRLGFREVGGRR